MYKGLKPELTDILKELEVGNAVVITSVDGNLIDKTAGYVHGITPKYIQIRTDRDPNSFFVRMVDWFSQTRVHYNEIKNIKIVD